MNEKRAARIKEGEDSYYLHNGLIVDHLFPGTGDTVKAVIGAAPSSSYNGYPSGKYGAKDRVNVNIEGFQLTEEQKLKVALVSPRNTISEIEEGERKAKYHAVVPDEVVDLIECPNDNCITNKQYEKSRMRVESRDEEGYPFQFRCHHCETPFERDELRLKFLKKA